jgi:DNA-binding response OmpR family regulator
VGGAVFVLLVDDDAAFANAAARSFESVGMRTVVALGSDAALDVFKSDEIDVVVTDVKSESFALARMIGNKRPQVPVILMSAYPELLANDIASPSAVLCKPLEIAELCRTIRLRQAQ